MAIPEPDDLGIQRLPAGTFDRDAAADTQLAHRPDDLDQQPLDRLDAPKDFDLVDRLYGRDERLQTGRPFRRIAVPRTVTQR